ncbi:SLC13 family permease [Halobacterium salinarum]|uniref:Citrate transporter n=1 Tax=Natrinema pellirubrum (strain DSM 15624 / CIP 106293 / JCM 10476 / NCIMB 786 / 157) TaxID=797303 RepID=L0JSA5_NATP1|nr:MULTISPECIES: SLC13 family permease [Halobacteria]AGB34129.1 Na+/H+ antiporter NhaD-like permease [Natrinema pellirubrum DSM 15624]ELY72205.1 citrate transporter [Natrinema pellirubrum DSM 15624]MDL0138979.1 SLC13 family permease [Halobacterium salinarum]
MVSETLVTGLVGLTFGLLFFRQIRVYPLTRAVTAATGAVVVVALGATSPEQALASIDTETILLLFGMLAHVEALSRSGFYPWAATLLVRRTGTVRRLVIGTLWVAAGLSALALNDAVVLLMTPVLIQAVKGTDTTPTGPLIAVILGANIGSLATPLGNPQNAYILSQSGLSTVAFVKTLAPVAFVSLLVASLLLAVQYDGTAVRSTVSLPDLDRQWALSSGGFLLATFVLLAAFPSTNAGIVAASMGVLHLAWLQLFRKVPGNDILAEMDWGILVLFVGLFVLVGSLEGTTLVDRLRAVDSGIGFAGVIFLLSNVVSNVPAVVLLSTTVTDPQSWYLLAAVSTLAGNATPVASAATLIVLDQASRRGVDISVGQLVRVGFPIAVVTTAVATGLLLF